MLVCDILVQFLRSESSSTTYQEKIIFVGFSFIIQQLLKTKKMCCVFYFLCDIATDCKKLYRQTVKVSSSLKELSVKHYSSVTAKEGSVLNLSFS